MPSESAQLRRLQPVRDILRSYRALTSAEGARRRGPGRPVLVACSGGADSCALAIALSAAEAAPAGLAHVIHDMRSEAEASADRDSVRSLAERLGVAYFERSISVAGGNAEAVARRGRYGALGEMAREAGVEFVATAHHADDQLETMLFALVRGTGLRGLRAMARRRRLNDDVMLIRPMLGVTHEDALAICRSFGCEWREDETNALLDRDRAYLRHEVLPLLRAMRPGVAGRAAGAAETLHCAFHAIDALAQSLDEHACVAASPTERAWKRADFRTAEPIVIEQLLRRTCSLVSGGSADVPGLDRIGRVQIERTVHAIRDADGTTREFRWGGSGGADGVVISVRRDRVVMAQGGPGTPPPEIGGKDPESGV